MRWVVIERMRSSTQVDDISEPFLLQVDSISGKESWTHHTRKGELEEVIGKSLAAEKPITFMEIISILV